MADTAADNQRIVLLNSLISLSRAKTKNHTPPTIGALESFKILEDRRQKKWAIEYFGITDEADSDDARVKAGQGHDYIRLCHLRFEKVGDYTYVTGLVEFMDVTMKSFPVVDYETLKGQEISGGRHERGAMAAHFVARIPNEHRYDDGKYRCAIEAVHGISRKDIEILFSRQLRRYAQSAELTFSAEVRKGKKTRTENFRFTPKLELHSDVGRRLDVAISGKGELSRMLFTKRQTRESAGQGTAVDHEEFFADIEIKVSASQGPADPAEKLWWLERIQDKYRKLGFKTKIFFRHASGAESSGSLHKAVDIAADLLMCQREPISLSKPPKQWVSTIQAETAEKMRELLDRDSLWERSK